MNKLDLDLKKTEELLINFVREETKKAGVSKVVLGVSGGIDSALVAYIATKALGKENVIGIMMPYKTSSKESLEHGELVIKNLGIEGEKIEITPMVEQYFNLEKDITPLRKGNRMARERMCILYDYSAKKKALVIGTSNKTEILLGYGTLYGDSASAFNPIGDLYKTQVWNLSRYMGVPLEIIDKRPSADLWEGQTDEEELGFSYLLADEILYYLVQEEKSIEDIEKLGYKKEVIDSIVKRIKGSEFKRRMPLIKKVLNGKMAVDFKI